ncbi:MAG: hypothetical protein K2L34_08640 [Muribaculaceae bacterium]|nr:hypothetical protein [Muribaculaceae bacterium]
MEFSEESVYLIGAILGLAISIAIAIPLGRANLNWAFRKSLDKLNKNELILRAAIASILMIISYYAVRIFYYYTSVIWLVTVGTIVELVLVYPYLRHVARRIIEDPTLPEESKIKSRSICKALICSQLGFILGINFALTLGAIPAIEWLMPDVVEVRNGPRRATYAYNVRQYYLLPFARGTRPGGSYIDNLSKDTVYRVVINYGYLGEDECNHFAVQGRYAPHAFTKMSANTFHVMDTIAPIMPASHNRSGRYHTQRVYLTDLEHLWDFRMLDMRRFGFKRNKLFDSLPEHKNRPIRENYEDYWYYKKILPDPYPRLHDIPDSVLKKRRKNVVNERTNP